MISFQKTVCKVYLQLPVRRIIGGEPAEIREFPWMVCTLLISFGIFIYWIETHAQWIHINTALDKNFEHVIFGKL